MKPFTHAVAAAAYIVLVTSVMNAFSTFASDAVPKPHPLLGPPAFLGLFVLSVAVMGYLFVYQPVALLIEKKSREALVFFTRTLLSFAFIVAVYVGIIFIWFSR